MKAQAFLILDLCFLTGTRDFLHDKSQDSPTKSLRVSTYCKCNHNAVSVPCFYDGLEMKTPQVLVSGSCPSTVWNTSLMSFCF